VMLSGRPPFPGATDADVQRKVRVGSYNLDGRTWANVSQNAKDLVEGLMCFNPRQRFTAEEALAHKWMEQLDKLDTSSLGEDMVEKLGSYGALSNLKRSALQAIALQLDDAQQKCPREQFTALDKNSDGMLTEQELAFGLQRAGIHLDAEELSNLVRSSDADGSGAVDYTEFLAATLDREVCLDEKACWLAFNVFDRNGDGRISLSELNAILRNNPAARPVPRKAVQDLLSEADGDGDGEISFAEFMEMMSTGDSEASTVVA